MVGQSRYTSGLLVPPPAAAGTSNDFVTITLSLRQRGDEAENARRGPSNQNTLESTGSDLQTRGVAVVAVAYKLEWLCGIREPHFRRVGERCINSGRRKGLQ